MAKKADAWKEYKEAAIIDMMLQVYQSRKARTFEDIICVRISYL